MSELSKKELTEQMNNKNREMLVNTGGIAALFVYNLENFAGRYLETSLDINIKCQFKGNDYWVESNEPNIVEALKWKNPDLKGKLISLCKIFPGSQSKNIQTKLILKTILISDKEVECSAHIICSTPKEENNFTISKKKNMVFEDPIELRNKHAAILEKVCEIF
jgi:hypothetical protein